MNAWNAWTTGFGIGIASLGGLWLTIRLALGSAHGLAIVAVSQVLRSGLTIAGFYTVAREAPVLLLPALIGFWLARRMLIGRWGGLTDVGT